MLVQDANLGELTESAALLDCYGTVMRINEFVYSSNSLRCFVRLFAANYSSVSFGKAGAPFYLWSSTSTLNIAQLKFGFHARSALDDVSIAQEIFSRWRAFHHFHPIPLLTSILLFPLAFQCFHPNFSVCSTTEHPAHWGGRRQVWHL